MSQITEAQAIKDETTAAANTATRVGSVIESIAGRTGWAQYEDNQYTEVAPFSLAANTDVLLPNNGLTKIETQKPTDVTEFYDGTHITGRNGDGIMITVEFTALPTSASTTYIEVWFDITGGTGIPANLSSLYRRIISFPKGNGVERPINFTVTGYTLNTWEANGAEVKVRANGTASLHTIRYVITRTHKAQ